MEITVKDKKKDGKKETTITMTGTNTGVIVMENKGNITIKA